MRRAHARVSALALGALLSVASCELVFPTELTRSSDASPSLDGTAPPTDATAPADSRPDSPLDATMTHDASTHDAPEAGPKDASGERAAREAAADAGACVPTLPPPPPISSSPGPATISFVAAVRTLTGIVGGDAGSTVGLGFDLDTVCTCEPTTDGSAGPSSCVPPTTPAPADCDQPGGRDLQGDQLLQLFDEAFANTSDGDLLTRIAQGAFTLLISVSDYNGGLNDGQVTVAAYASTGVRAPDGAIVTPKWDGTDEWSVDPGSVASPIPTEGGFAYVPTYSTATAYVTQGVLVAQLPAMPFELGFGIIPLRGVVLAATITPDGDGGYDISGQLGARLKTSDVFGILGRLREGDAGAICGTNPLFVSARAEICQTADIMSSPSLDNQGATCDALSLAAGFHAVSARFGPTFSIAENDAGCDGGIDDCTP